jgi:hypothetical protein
MASVANETQEKAHSSRAINVTASTNGGALKHFRIASRPIAKRLKNFYWKSAQDIPATTKTSGPSRSE